MLRIMMNDFPLAGEKSYTFEQIKFKHNLL